jgi:biotin operon repressor
MTSPEPRPTPHDIDAERSILGPLLTDPALLPIAIGAGLTEHSFFRQLHRDVFRSLVAMDGQGDLVTVSNDLARKSPDDNAIRSNIASLMEWAIDCSPEAIQRRAALLTRLERRRAILKTARELEECAHDGDPLEIASDFSIRFRDLSAGLDPSRSIARFTNAATSATELVARTIPPKLSLLGNRTLTAGGFGILYGKPGLGKSWLAIELGLAIVRGGEWLGIPTHASGSRVGLVQLELPDDSMQARLRLLGVGDHPLDGDLRIVCRPDLRGVVDLCRPGEFDALRDWINRDGLKLIALDAFSRAHTASENKAEEVNAVLAGVDALRHDTGCAVLLVHHERKSMAGGGNDDDMDALRGSSRFQSDPTLLVRIKATSGGLKAIHFAKVSEGAQVEDIHVRSSESGFPIVVPSPGSVSDGNKQRVLDTVLTSSFPGVSQGDISTSLGLSSATTRRHLEALASEGKVVRSGKNKGARYSPVIAQSLKQGDWVSDIAATTSASKDLWDSGEDIAQ